MPANCKFHSKLKTQDPSKDRVPKFQNSRFYSIQNSRFKFQAIDMIAKFQNFSKVYIPFKIEDSRSQQRNDC